MTLLGYSMEPNLHVCSLVKIVETVLVTLTESCEKSSVLMQDKGDLKNVEPQWGWEGRGDFNMKVMRELVGNFEKNP